MARQKPRPGVGVEEPIRRHASPVCASTEHRFRRSAVRAQPRRRRRALRDPFQEEAIHADPHSSRPRSQRSDRDPDLDPASGDFKKLPVDLLANLFLAPITYLLKSEINGRRWTDGKLEAAAVAVLAGWQISHDSNLG